MLRFQSAPGAIVLLLCLLAFAGCGEDSPIRVSERAGVSDGGPDAPQAQAGASRTGTGTPRASATPVELLCGRRDLSAKITPEGRLRSPAPPSPVKPASLTAKHDDTGLRETIERSLGDRAGDFGVAVVSLRDGRSAFLNDDRSFYAASLFKLTVLYEVYRQWELRSLSFDEQLLYTPYYQKYDLAGAPFPPCSQVAVGTLVNKMITISDNASAVMLQDRVGATAVNQDMRALGLTNTTLEASGIRTTARDMALLLEQIARGQAVTAEASRAMLDLLLTQTVRNRIPAGVPRGVPVGNKTGDWEDATHDVAIVVAPFGTYVLAVLSDQGSAAPIVRLSANVYRYLGTGETPSPTPTPSVTPSASATTTATAPPRSQ